MNGRVAVGGKRTRPSAPLAPSCCAATHLGAPARCLKLVKQEVGNGKPHRCWSTPPAVSQVCPWGLS